MIKIRCTICGQEAEVTKPAVENIAAELSELLDVDIDPASIILDLPATCPDCNSKWAAETSRLIH